MRSWKRSSPTQPTKLVGAPASFEPLESARVEPALPIPTERPAPEACDRLVGRPTAARCPASRSEALVALDVALRQDIERRDLAIQGGRQDHYCAAFGGFNFMEFTAGESLINPLRIPPEWMSELEYSIVLAYTGTSRASSEIIADQIRNVEAGEADSVTAMEATRAAAFEMKRLLLKGEFRAFGEALHEAWLVKKRMSGKISNPHIDAIYDAARAAGALGGKISGAGGGGFMFFFTDFDRRHRVVEALQAEGAEVVHFGFTDVGLQTWVR